MVVLVAFLLFIVLLALHVVPLAFFGMLFLGNLGLHFSFWTCLPGAIAIKIALSNNNTATTTK